MCLESREKSTKANLDEVKKLKSALEGAEAVVIGAGAGLSASAGFTYSGERFEKYFSEFIEAYSIPDMYSGGFYPYQTLEEYWGWWSRHIYYNRYVDAPRPVYPALLDLVKGKEYFVLTTNVDHCFQKAGFDKSRLFYTQGDYGLFQCVKPCHQKTYDNEREVKQMLKQQKNRKIPTELIPLCPICGRPMCMNLRADDTFVQDEGWYEAAERYQNFIRRYEKASVLFLELGVGANTPGIIKYPFWQMTLENSRAVYACINNKEASCPHEIQNQSIVIESDIGNVIKNLQN